MDVEFRDYLSFLGWFLFPFFPNSMAAMNGDVSAFGDNCRRISSCALRPCKGKHGETYTYVEDTYEVATREANLT